MIKKRSFLKEKKKGIQDIRDELINEIILSKLKKIVLRFRE